jgi:hypothetical protein
MRWAAALAPALALALAVATYPQAASASSSSFMDDVQSPLPGTERGSPESYVRNFESVFAEELLEALLRELAPLDTMGNTETRLPFGKRQTFWTALNEPPRFAAERAVKLLQELTFPAALGGPEAIGIVGCTYWVLARGSDSDVDFHYDKDEGLASEMQKMKLPPLVGVTHLEDFGAPTVVLNQSTIRNGNLDAPTLPSSGWLVYPKRNKHCLHRGDLHHGAPQDMAAAPVPHDAKRHSFITSWEVKKPLEPNCRRVTDAELQDKLAPHSLFPPGSPQWSDFSGLSDALAEVAPQRMDWSQEAAVVRRRVQLPLGEVAHLDVLREPESGVTYWVDWSGGDRSADSTDDDGATTGGTFDDGLGPGLSFMGVFEMDLKDQLQMKHIYHSHSVRVLSVCVPLPCTACCQLLARLEV